MKLYIAEKPSLARALVAALPQQKPAARKKEEGFITLANGDVVSWCIGHLLELAEPEAYDPAFKKWRLEHLPIQPAQWQYQPKPKTKKQLNILLKLIKRASSFVHVGDPDREGQLLIDEVLNYAGVTKTSKPVARCLVSDLNTPAIKKALANMQSNSAFAPLSTSALARSRADWLYGINMTRLCSIKGKKPGKKGVLSVGRVQTPVLGLVVARDREIDSFVSKPFYEVMAQLLTDSHAAFQAKWRPSDACQKFCDEQNRLLSKPLAENIASRITGKNGLIKKVDKKRKRYPPPLPYNLSSLQIDASKAFGMAAKAVLDTCQSLYEKHKLITYPRSDCRHLPLDHFTEAAGICSTIAKNSTKLASHCQAADTQHKSKAWNNAKITAHHAIIPTARAVASGRLNAQEQKVYELIARQYLMQFFPHQQIDETHIEVQIETGIFDAKAKVIVDEGWHILMPKSTKASGLGGQNRLDGQSKPDEQNKPDENSQYLPPLKAGDTVFCAQGIVNEKHTTPPKRFTDATLIAAMTGIARFVSDNQLKKILKDTDGLGTEATRANILDLLIKRRFIERKGKTLIATATGKSLIDFLPAQATTPDMTAEWESQLDDISQQRAQYRDFMGRLTQQLGTLMTTLKRQ